MPAESTNDPTGEWVERWLSRPRFAVYLSAAEYDHDAALELYEWNARLGSALSHDLAHLEVPQPFVNSEKWSLQHPPGLMLSLRGARLCNGRHDVARCGHRTEA